MWGQALKGALEENTSRQRRARRSRHRYRSIAVALRRDLEDGGSGADGRPGRSAAPSLHLSYDMPSYGSDHTR